VTRFITNDVIHCINYLQSVPFIINKELLNYLLDCIENNINLTDILVINLHPDTNKIYTLKKDEVLVKNILSSNSKYYENRSHISLALLLQDYIFYHPLFMD